MSDRKRQRAPQLRAVQTRAAILRAAAEVFDEFGFSGASISKIMKRADVTQGGMYFHFGSKEELAYAVMVGQGDGLEFPEGEDGLQHLVDITLYLAEQLQHNPVLRAGVRLAVEQGSSACAMTSRTRPGSSSSASSCASRGPRGAPAGHRRPRAGVGPGQLLHRGAALLPGVHRTGRPAAADRLAVALPAARRRHGRHPRERAPDLAAGAAVAAGGTGATGVSAPHVVVTGATGFVGSAVLRRLAAQAPQAVVRAVSRTPPATAHGVRWVDADLAAAESLRGVCDGADVLLSLASYIGPDAERCAAVNSAGTEALVAEARRAGVGRIVQLSTCAVYGPGPHRGQDVGELTPAPVSPASRSRLAGEEPVLEAGDSSCARGWCWGRATGGSYRLSSTPSGGYRPGGAEARGWPRSSTSTTWRGSSWHSRSAAAVAAAVAVATRPGPRASCTPTIRSRCATGTS